MSSALPGYEQAAALVAGYAAQLREKFLGAGVIRIERVGLAEAVGRVLARPVFADSDQPPFARSTRDGYACRAIEASEHGFLRLAGATHAGEAPGGPLPAGAAWEIMTGAPVPEGADTVVMLEHVEAGEGKIRLRPPRKAAAGENIVAQGAQARKGDELLPIGTRIASGQVALAASCGNATIEVFGRPRIAILTTGDELVAVESSLAPGQIRNSNAPMLGAMVTAAGGEPWILPPAADTAWALDAALAKAEDADMLLISGGVSAGKFDLVEPALARLGAKFHFTGVRMQPGKPLVFGELPRNSAASSGLLPVLPFFGLPGNPVSSAVTFLLFGSQVLAALAGSLDPNPGFVLAQMASTADHRVKPGLTRFLPAKCSFDASTERLPAVSLVPWQGSGDLTALARSNCFLVIPEEAGSLDTGSIVRILLP